MKVLLVNKFYYPRGGDCVCTINLQNLLEKNGHEVAVFAMAFPDNIPTVWEKYFPSEVRFTKSTKSIEAILRPFGTNEVISQLNLLLDEFSPEIIHLNNIHTQLSPVVAKIAKQRGIKVVWTLHDYKLLCPRSDSLKNDTIICEDCYLKSKYNVVRNRCTKGSFIGSFLAYLEALKWKRSKLEKYTDVFVCPSEFMRNKMIKGGFSADKTKTICNFIDVSKTYKEDYKKEEYYCYVGRLSNEKGIPTLIEATEKLPFKLKIIGSGPLMDKLKEQTYNSHIEVLGSKNWDEIKGIVSRARFMVIPSEWYENNPMSVIESLCLGTPVIGSNTGGIPELLKTHPMNVIYEMKNVEDLKEKISMMWEQDFQENDYRELASCSQKIFNEVNYYNKIMDIYNEKDFK